MQSDTRHHGVPTWARFSFSLCTLPLTGILQEDPHFLNVPQLLWGGGGKCSNTCTSRDIPYPSHDICSLETSLQRCFQEPQMRQSREKQVLQLWVHAVHRRPLTYADGGLLK